MKLKNNLKRICTGIVVATLLATMIPINSFAASNPWDKYKEYIPIETPIEKRHVRGVWVSSVINLDWPSLETRNIKSDSLRIEKSKEELIEILDKSVQMNMNTVFFQVSPEGDALYNSSIVPWSRYLTGTFGKDPGFDPLEFAIKEAHKRNLELHAWFNPYRISMNNKAETVESLNIDKSIYKEEPTWIRTAKSRFVVDPGIPGAREWVKNRVMEVVNNYDIDGVHFDDYFYYEDYMGQLDDAATFNKYNSGKFSNLGDWRRNNTYLLVKEIGKEIEGVKPWIKFGVSPTAVWGNKKDGHSEGSNTNAGLPNYDKSFADTKKWVEEEIIDYISPQIYFSFGNPHVPYGEISDWWSKVVEGKNVHLYIGQALYKINDDTDLYFRGDSAISEFDRQLKFNTTNPNIQGSIMFRYDNLVDANKVHVVDSIKNNLWKAKALVPLMPWKKGATPTAPTDGKLEEVSSGTRVIWNDKDNDTAYYAVYRVKKGHTLNINSDESAKYLLGTVRKNSSSVQEYVDRSNKDIYEWDYIITSLDRLHNESKELIIYAKKSQYFGDVTSSYFWAVDAIDALYEKNVVQGVEAGVFSPDANTKRADFILMVVRALNLNTEFEDNFLDVPKDSYYYDATGIARELGLVLGTKEGVYFSPNSNITREDLIVILDRILNRLEITLDETSSIGIERYSDKDKISDYAKGAIDRLTKTGLIQGSNGRVNPKNAASRAEVAVMLYNLLEAMET